MDVEETEPGSSSSGSKNGDGDNQEGNNSQDESQEEGDSQDEEGVKKKGKGRKSKGGSDGKWLEWLFLKFCVIVGVIVGLHLEKEGTRNMLPYIFCIVAPVNLDL